MSGDWYSSGYEEAERIQEEQQQARESSQAGRRFFLKDAPGDDPQNPRNQAQVIIASGVEVGNSEPFTIWEHSWPPYQPGVKARPQEYTCTRGMGRCVFCERQVPRYFIGFWTMIDCRQWKDRDGKIHVNEKKLLGAKTEMITAFKQRQQMRDNNLCGSKWTVFRTGSKKARIGDMWEWMDRVDLSTLVDGDGQPLDLSPINYREVLKPISVEEQEKILEGYAGPNSSGNTSSAGAPQNEAPGGRTAY